MSLIRILILEDNPSDAELTLHQIRQEIGSCVYDLANDRRSFLAQLKKYPDVILADYSLPQFTALDALELVQQQELDIPMIIVSGTIGEEVAVEAMRMGATDYLLKDRLGRLNSAILRALEEAQTRRARRIAEEALRESEARYRSLFEDSPVSLWEEDFSGVKKEIERIQSGGVADPYSYYKNDLTALRALIGLRKISAVNRATLRMYQGENMPEAIAQLLELFSEESLLQFLEELFAFYRGKKHFSCESVHRTLQGNEIFVTMNASLAPGYKDTWGKVFTTVVDISARKRAEGAILRSERLLRSVLDASPDWIFAKDREGCYVIANQTFADDMNLTVQEILGKTDIELGFPSRLVTGEGRKESEGFIGTDQLVFETGEPVYNYDVTVNHNSGKQWVFDSVKVPLRDHAGAIWAVLGSARDISDRLRNERALRESEELLSKLMESNPNAIYVLNDKGQYRLINQATVDILGLPKEQIIGSSNAEIAKKGGALGREANLFWRNTRQVLLTGKSAFLPEESITTRDGVMRWFQTRLIPLNYHRNDKMVLGVSTDITERKQAADLLKRLNETLELRVNERTAKLEATTRDLALIKDQLETILQNSPDGFLLLDAKGNIQQVNHGYLRMMNISADDVLQKDFLSHLNQIGVTEGEQYLQQAIQERHHGVFEVQIGAASIPDFSCQISMVPVYEAETLNAMVINFHDVSGMKEVQRMKDAFVSNVSHELRTPITNFICNLELMRIRPENMNVYLNRLDRETEHLRKLIEDLLNLSRLDQKAIGVGKTHIDLNNLCRNFIEMRAPLAEANGLALHCQVADEPAMTFADEGLINQVLSILLTNALNYTPAGGEIQVYVQKGVHDGRREVGFSVHDTGPGISFEDQKRITQRFYRGSVGLESGVGGTGLGLSIAEEILSLHSGHLEISSDGIPGHGAVFTVWLPVGDEE